MRCEMAIRTRRATVELTLPRAEAHEFLAELTLELGLEVRFLHGRITERETRLALEIVGEPDGVERGIRHSRDRNRRSPFLNHAS
jgi:hypothetical protein